MNVKITLALLLGTVAIFNTSTRAESVRTGSGYGAVETYAACSTSTSTCIGVGTPFTIDIGGTDYQALQYAFFQNGAVAPTISEIVDFGPVSGGSSFELPVFNTGLSLSGVFSCGGDQTVITDNMGNDVAGVPCTPGAFASDSSNVTQMPGRGVMDFTINASTSDLVLFANGTNLNVGGVASTPEPNSLALLGIGLVPLAILSRRRVHT